MQFQTNLTLGIFLLGTICSAKEVPSLVRVRMASKILAIQISGISLRIHRDGFDSGIIPVAVAGDESLSIERKCKEKSTPCFWKIERTRGSQKSLKYSFERNLVVEGEKVSSQNRPWPRRIQLLSTSSSSFDVLANVETDHYLTGVLASEMPLNWPEEALKAQAVVARSYLLATQAERKLKQFDVEASVLDQVFQDVMEQGSNSPQIRRVAGIIHDTRSIILRDRHSRILKAHYHSDCGGETESAENVWKDSAPTVVVKDKFCGTRWHYQIAKAELLAKLQISMQLPHSPEKIEGLSLTPVPRPNSARLDSVLFHSEGHSFSLSSAKLREALGYANIKSTAFSISDRGADILFEGQGYGHGVGMCQWGSRAWAQHGWSMKQILAHYYPEDQISVIR